MPQKQTNRIIYTLTWYAFTTSGHETYWAYFYSPAAHTKNDIEFVLHFPRPAWGSPPPRSFLHFSEIFVNKNENGEKRENNEFVNKN